MREDANGESEVWHSCLIAKRVPRSVVAQLHASDMAAGNYFNHYSQNGSSPYDRVSVAFPAVRDMAEVEAAGWTSVRAVLLQLMW